MGHFRLVYFEFRSLFVYSRYASARSMDVTPVTFHTGAAGKLHFAAHDLLSRLTRRERCPHFRKLQVSGALADRDTYHDLDRIVRVSNGRAFSPYVMGEHPRWQSLTDVFNRGSAQAEHLRSHLQPGDVVLEYNGGIGRIGRAIAEHVQRVVSVDADPLMKLYGPVVSPGVDFRERGELPESETFDAAYAVESMRHLSASARQEMLDYVYRRLKPGGWLLVDLAPAAGGRPASGDDRTAALEQFRAMYEPLFSARRVPLFNAGFLLRKGTPDPVTPVPSEGRYTVNEASVVADVLEGEVVVVNLDNGSYYILQGTASVIWQLLAAGRTVPEIVEMLSRRHSEDAARIAAEVPEFIGQLTSEALLVPATADGRMASTFDDSQLPAHGTPFDAPVMFRYSDMQALIQMDPIREYDETGWPVRNVSRVAGREG